MIARLCMPYVPVWVILASALVVGAYLLRSRLLARGSKETDFDWNLHLLTALFVLGIISLVAFLAFVLVRIGKC